MYVGFLIVVFISIIIGAAIILRNVPTTVYPTVLNAGKVVYVDENKNLYKYRIKNLNC